MLFFAVSLCYFSYDLMVIVNVADLRFSPARRYASAGNRDRNVSVRPSVRPSRAGIVSKRIMLAA